MSGTLRDMAMQMLAMHYDCAGEDGPGKLAGALAAEAAGVMHEIGMRKMEGHIKMSEGSEVKFVIKLVLAEEN